MATAIACEEFELSTLMDDAQSVSIGEEAESAENSEDDCIAVAPPIASIKAEIDAEIHRIRTEAIMAVQNSLEDLGTGEMIQSNLEIEAALRRTTERDWTEATARGVPEGFFSTECKLAAYIAEETVNEAVLVVRIGSDSMKRISTKIEGLKTSISKLEAKTLHSGHILVGPIYYTMARFYAIAINKYKRHIVDLEKRHLEVNIVMERLTQCMHGYKSLTAVAEKVTDETQDESRNRKLTICRWINEAQSVIIVALKKEYDALHMVLGAYESEKNEEVMEKIVKQDVEEPQQSERLNREPQQNEKLNGGLKIKIGSVACTIVGLLLLSNTFIEKFGSEPFYVSLLSGLVLIGLGAGYWSFQLYKCLKRNRAIETAQLKDGLFKDYAKQQDAEFYSECDRRHKILRAYLRKYAKKPVTEDPGPSDVQL